MRLHKLLLAAPLAISSGAALADQTMEDLHSAAQAIELQLQLANNLAWEIDMNAHMGFIAADGTENAALINEQMVSAYNGALQNVRNASYLTASDILVGEHNAAIDSMHTAIDNLVEATTVLQTVSAVADMAADATTTEDMLEVQQAVTITDMSVDQQDVDNFNEAITDIQTFAQQAGAYLAASEDSDITSQLDNFASQNNIAMASYTAVSYVQGVDQLMITFDQSNSYISFQGYMTGNTKTAAEIYEAIGYNG